MLALASGQARAEDVLISLNYQADPALPGCPDEQSFSAAIIRHLGSDPFRPPAAHHLVVRISPAGPHIEGRVEWRDTSDQWEGERTFSARNESCEQMVRAMALATAIQIQLLALAAPVGGSAPPPVDALPPEPVVAPVVPVVPARPPEPRLGLEVGLAVMKDVGGVHASIAPRLAVSFGRPSALAVRLAASAFGPTVEVPAPDGVAQVDRVLVTLQLVHFFRAGRRLQPFAAAGGGVQDVRVHGISVMPALGAGHDGQTVTALATAGGGLAVSFAAGLFALVEVDGTLYGPDVAIQVGNEPAAARLGGQGLLAHGGLLARF